MMPQRKNFQPSKEFPQKPMISSDITNKNTLVPSRKWWVYIPRFLAINA